MPSLPTLCCPNPLLRPQQADGNSSPLSAVTHRSFKPARSSTFRLPGKNFELEYGSGKISGFLGYDTVRVMWKLQAQAGLALEGTAASQADTDPLGGPAFPKVPSGSPPTCPGEEVHLLTRKLSEKLTQRNVCVWICCSGATLLATGRGGVKHTHFCSPTRPGTVPGTSTVTIV